MLYSSNILKEIEETRNKYIKQGKKVSNVSYKKHPILPELGKVYQIEIED